MVEAGIEGEVVVEVAVVTIGDIGGEVGMVDLVEGEGSSHNSHRRHGHRDWWCGFGGTLGTGDDRPPSPLPPLLVGKCASLVCH